jgi:hypothetical protein
MRLRACERPASSHRSLVPQPGHRIGERVYCGAPIRGTGARCRDLALAEHVPDQFRKPGWSDDHCLDVQFHQRPPSPLRPRRITTDPAFCFNALSEFLAFIVRRSRAGRGLGRLRHRFRRDRGRA